MANQTQWRKMYHNIQHWRINVFSNCLACSKQIVYQALLWHVWKILNKQMNSKELDYAAGLDRKASVVVLILSPLWLWVTTVVGCSCYGSMPTTAFWGIKLHIFKNCILKSTGLRKKGFWWNICRNHHISMYVISFFHCGQPKLKLWISWITSILGCLLPPGGFSGPFSVITPAN